MIAILMDRITVASVNLTQRSKARVFRLRTVTHQPLWDSTAAVFTWSILRMLCQFLTSLLKVVL